MLILSKVTWITSICLFKYITHNDNDFFVTFQELVNTAFCTLFYILAFIVQLAVWSGYGGHARGANIAAGVRKFNLLSVQVLTSFLLFPGVRHPQLSRLRIRCLFAVLGTQEQQDNIKCQKRYHYMSTEYCVHLRK